MLDKLFKTLWLPQNGILDIALMEDSLNMVSEALDTITEPKAKQLAESSLKTFEERLAFILEMYRDE